MGEVLKLKSRPEIAVGLQTHSMTRALELMNAGAWECVPPSVLDSDLEKIIKKGIERAESEPVRFPAKTPFWKKKWFALGALLLIFAVGGGTVFKVRHDKKERIRSERETYAAERQFPLPYSHPSGIALEGRYFWISDWYAQSIYKHEPSPEGIVMLAVYHLSDMNPIAICWEGPDLWVLSSNHKLQKYEVKQKLTRLQSARTPGDNATGLAYDGRNIWTADAAAKKMYRHTMDKTLTVEAEFPYPGTPQALFCHEGALWSLDGDQNRLLRHTIKRDKMTEKMSVDKTVAMGKENHRRVGAAFDGERFWTVVEKPPLIIRHMIDNE